MLRPIARAVTAALLLACSGDDGILPPSGEIPTITQLTPDAVPRGGSALALVVEGRGFAETAAVRFGGSVRPTTRESTTRLVATLGADDVATERTVAVSVANRPPAGDTSAAVSFVVLGATTAAPVLTSVLPSSIRVPAADPRITLGGQHFGGASEVVLSTATAGPIRPATFFITTDALRFRISDAAIAPHLPQAAGQSVTFEVLVETPGVGTSQPLTLVVTR